MDTLYRINLMLHVLCGVVGLLVMLVPLLARKGARTHRHFGWAFVIAMSLVSVTGIDMALSWVLAPAHFRPGLPVQRVMIDAMFLTLIGALTANALGQAIFALRQKCRPKAVPVWHVNVLFALLAFSALISLALGVADGDPLSLVFGAGALALLARDLRFTFLRFASPHAYLYQHINAVGTACISVLTAFLVLGARRVLSADILGTHAWWLWVTPTLVFAPLFQLWGLHYRRTLERPRPAKTPKHALIQHV